jgi:hypothetical protein
VSRSVLCASWRMPWRRLRTPRTPCSWPGRTCSWPTAW